MNLSSRKLVRLVLLLFIFGDLAYSFWQYNNFPIDEDLARIVVPDIYYRQVLEDPLGLEVWKSGEGYQATNRFAAHYTIRAYFRTVPHWLQFFLDPIDSLYWSAAFFKLLVQLLLLSQMSRYTLSVFRDTRMERLAVLAFFLPFFQAMGYQLVFGIIDSSITYTFFYAWPLAWLMVFYWPFYRRLMLLPHRYQSGGSKVMSIILALVLPFSGPLVAPIVLIISFLYFFHQFRFLYVYGFRQKAWAALVAKGGFTMLVFILVSVVSLYSFILGTYNVENQLAGTLAITERFELLPRGLWHHFKAKLAYPLLLLALVGNALILKYSKPHYSWSCLRPALPYFVAGVILYLCLLPLGGYRDYRPDILRRDTLLPVLLMLLLWLGWTSVSVAKVLPGIKRRAYLAALIAICVIFTLADGPNARLNACERRGLAQLSKATESPVQLSVECPVLAWNPYEDPKHSQWNAVFLQQLGITERVILYKNANPDQPTE
jgi:hypothetical protein